MMKPNAMATSAMMHATKRRVCAVHVRVDALVSVKCDESVRTGELYGQSIEPSICLRNFTPFHAISSRVGSILRQIAAARARALTSEVKDSMTTSPS